MSREARMRDINVEAKMEVAKAIPALGGAVVYGFTLNEWVAISVIIYTVLQAAYLVWKWWHEAKAKRNGQ